MSGRELTPLQRGVILKMLELDRPNAAELRASVPFLRVHGGCGCGCESFDVEDARFAPQEWYLEEFSSASSKNGTQLLLLLGADGRLASVDILMPDQGKLPDPRTLRVY